MEHTLFESFVKLRSVIGFLGEETQYSWWISAFFTPHSPAFLNPVFTRTPNLARYSGVTESAARVHDERIGVGRVYHLFRLPEDMEQRLHIVAQGDGVWAEIQQYLDSCNAALAYLRQMASEPAGYAEGGPTRIGNIEDVRQSQVSSLLAARYLTGFEHNLPTYPYFANPRS